MSQENLNKDLNDQNPDKDEQNEEEFTDAQNEDQAIELRRTLKNKRTAALGNVTKKRNELVDLMTHSDNLHLVKTALQEFNDRYVIYRIDCS